MGRAEARAPTPSQVAQALQGQDGGNEPHVRAAAALAGMACRLRPGSASVDWKAAARAAPLQLEPVPEHVGDQPFRFTPAEAMEALPAKG